MLRFEQESLGYCTERVYKKYNYKLQCLLHNGAGAILSKHTSTLITKTTKERV